MAVVWGREGFRWVALLVGLVLGVAFAALFTGSARAADSNQVEFWCDVGIKVEPIGTPSFTVPPPPDGFTWTLLVVKSATDNEVFPNPIPGQSYTPTNGHDVSHVILCMEPTGDPSTTTTTDPSTTTTTDPSTTTTTDPSTTTTTDPSTTTTTDSSTTLPGETKTTESPPVGGVNAGGGATAASGWEAAVLWLAGGAVALLGGTTALAMRRSSGRE
jgi:hypothetical protein